MVKRENKNYDLMIGEDKKAKTVDLIKICLNQVPQNGYTFDDLRNRERIDKAIENGIIELEDSDFKNLQGYVKTAKWTSRHPDLLDFINEFVTK